MVTCWIKTFQDSHVVTDEGKVELFEGCVSNYIKHKTNITFRNVTSCQWSKMMMAVW